MELWVETKKGQSPNEKLEFVGYKLGFFNSNSLSNNWHKKCKGSFKFMGLVVALRS